MTDPSPDEGPRKDQDDPEAPILLTEKNKNDSQGPGTSELNNGREPSAVPKPPDQVKQITEGDAAAGDTPVEKLDTGRDPAAKPGLPSADEPAATEPDAGNRDARKYVGRSDPKVDATPPAKTATRPRKEMTDLPDSVQSLDKDGDGQIGLYEWPREKISQFTELDGDKDGFLTPQELHDGATAQREDSPAAKQKPAKTQPTEGTGGEASGDSETEVGQGKEKPTSNPSTEQEGP